MLQSPTTAITLHIVPPCLPHAVQVFLPLWRVKLRAALTAPGQRSILPGQIDGKQSTDYTSCSGTAGHQRSSWTPGPTSWATSAEVREPEEGTERKLADGK